MSESKRKIEVVKREDVPIKVPSADARAEIGMLEVLINRYPEPARRLIRKQSVFRSELLIANSG